MNRRWFIGGLLAAPAIIQANHMMKLRGIVMPFVHKRWEAYYKPATDQIMWLCNFSVNRKLELLPVRFNLGFGSQLMIEKCHGTRLKEAELLALNDPNGISYACNILRDHRPSDHQQSTLG